MSFYSTNLFPEFPDHSKVWIYQADRFLDEQVSTEIQAKVDSFTREWSAHKLHVKASGLLLENLFLILVANETDVTVSGCSIDSSVRFIKELEQTYQLSFFNRMKIAYRDGDKLRVDDAFELLQKINSGAINSDLYVFNNTIQKLEDLKTKWLVPIADSWLGARIEKIMAQ
jgi:hypothetical protein